MFIKPWIWMEEWAFEISILLTREKDAWRLWVELTRPRACAFDPVVINVAISVAAGPRAAFHSASFHTGPRRQPRCPYGMRRISGPTPYPHAVSMWQVTHPVKKVGPHSGTLPGGRGFTLDTDAMMGGDEWQARRYTAGDEAGLCEHNGPPWAHA